MGSRIKSSNKNTTIRLPETNPSSRSKKEEEELNEAVRRELFRMKKRRNFLLIISCLSVLICFTLLFFNQYEKYRKSKETEILSELVAKQENANIPLSSSPFLNNTIDGISDTINTVNTQPQILEQYKLLYESNKKLIGWLQIDDTLIDYPVMQTVDNEYYLNHNFSQEEDRNGSLFLDSNCSINPMSDNLIIYGHHMKSGNMFGELDHYQNETFFKTHQTIRFDSIYEEGFYEVMYVFRSKVFSEEEICFKYYQFINAASEEEFYSNMNEMAVLSLYDTGVTAQYGDSILTLSTCDYSEPDGRFVVVAKKTY